ncbi:MAG: P-loop NTPase [Candidatus Erginobacter occultus]|nr:P-loop NTPase [Candidatus Erginobacter occultus]
MNTHCADPGEYSPTAFDHVRSPRHYGPLPTFNGRARITGACGDTMEFWLEVQGDRVKNISFITDGCGPSLASGSMAATLAAGQPLVEAAVLRQKDILEALGGLPAAVEHCALLAADTLQAACVDYLQRRDGESSSGRKIIVLSGKGGTGKSTVAVNLAAALAAAGKRVGLLDADITGPAAALLLGLERKGIANRGPTLLPAGAGDMKAISLGLLPENPEEAPEWRGPEKKQVIERFLTGTDWGELDFLIIDCPPGLGDEPLAVRELAGDGLEAVIVTTPQKLSAEAAKEAILFCRRQGIEVLGVVENMAGFACPDCGRSTRILRAGGGRKISDDLKVPFLGSIPIDPTIAECGDRGRIFLEQHPDSPAAEIIRKIARLPAAGKVTPR